MQDSARIHHRDLIGDGKRFAAVVRDVNRGQTRGVDQTADFHDQLFTRVGIQRTQGFIEQQQFGLRRQAARQGHALLFSAGEMSHITLRKSRHPDLCQGFCRPLLLFAACQVSHFEAESHIFRDVEVWEEREILKHQADAALMGGHGQQILPLQGELPGSGSFQAGNDAKQGGFATTAGAQQAEDLPTFQRTFAAL